jgi:glycosyltransferase involved in cell wall biosynthesis
VTLATVIVLSYNQSDYLRQSVSSALAQTYAEIEVLVIENGSTDTSNAVLEDFTDPRVRVLAHCEHAWPGIRMNEGVRAARGEFISFLYSDDRYLPEKIALQVDKLQHLGAGYGVVYCPAIRENALTGDQTVARSLGAQGHVFESLLSSGLRRGHLDMISPLIRRDLLLAHPFHEDVFFESEAIFYRLALYTQFAFLARPLVVALDHESNGGKRLGRHRQMSCECVARLRGEAGLGPRRHLVRDHEARLNRYYGWQGARIGAPRAWTLDCFRAAFRASPRRALHPKVLAGVCLTLVPRRLQTTVNRLAFRLKGTTLRPVWLDDYDTLRHGS